MQLPCSCYLCSAHRPQLAQPFWAADATSQSSSSDIRYEGFGSHVIGSTLATEHPLAVLVALWLLVAVVMGGMSVLCAATGMGIQ